MKKITYLIVVGNFIFAQNIQQSCLIDYSKYSALSKQEILSFAKHCKMPKEINNSSIQNTKIIYVTLNKTDNKNQTVHHSQNHFSRHLAITTNTAHYNYQKPNKIHTKPKKPVNRIVKQKKVKQKKQTIKINKKLTVKTKKTKKNINLANISLHNLLQYAIKHNLTTPYIGKLIIKKSENPKYSNLDTDYIKNIFSKKFTKEDLKNLLNALETIN